MSNENSLESTFLGAIGGLDESSEKLSEKLLIIR
jgi:hypothetical protein